MDKRIVKTRKNIIDVFLQLLEEKAVSHITAQEIIDLAEISRSTFYQHYTDVYDLLDQAEDAIFIEISNLLKGYTYEAIKADPLRLFTELFFYFQQNAKICLVLINKNGGITTGQRISKMIQNKFKHEWEALINCENEFLTHYLSQYIITGFVGILQKWIEGGMKEPVEDMAFVTRFFINNSIENIKNEMEVASEMSTFKEKIHSDAKGFAGGVLNETSALIDEKSADIQKKVEAGLNIAIGRLAQRGNHLQTEQSTSAAEKEHKQQKLLKKRTELDESTKRKLPS
ncbi:TetR/AcrR family transcriptional regulator [Paenibacillus sp. 1001270B_150601_E10]|uniref:TetR/AcrR family transcriptional regulator n=1 Tax=Paenibacillus sp. 1001270B_150601_E10 TaxID=2787079 RepID=UPI00189E4FB9|nr:TetR/AcrR family transcriptional regulator [Paenibacillus sp. 1001270B_150601_E10]